jgi:hypothetical protein
MSKKWRKAKMPIQARDCPADMRIISEGSVSIAASVSEGGLPTFEGNAYTGAAMRPDGWWDSVIIDLDGVKLPSQHRPVLRQHDHEQIVGHSTKITVDREGIHVQGVFSGQKEHADKVTVPAKNGFKWQMSVGANPIRKEYLESGKKAVVNGKTVTGPLVISRETEIGELSFVPLGADGKTSAKVAANKGKAMNPFQAALKDLMAELKAAGKSCTYSDDEIDNMDQKGAKAALKKAMKAAEDDDGDDDKETKKTKASAAVDMNAEASTILAKFKADMKAENDKVAANQVRQQAILAACKQYEVSEVEVDVKGTKTKVNLAAHAIQEDWTVEQAELAAIKASRPGAGVGIPGGYGYSTTTPQASEAVFEAALLQASRHSFRLEDNSFYQDTLPNGVVVRRVPERMQREAQGELKARYTDQVQQAAHTLFKGRIGLHQFFRCISSEAQKVELNSEHGWKSVLSSWGHQEAIKASGASNISISNILSNVLNKFALQGYLFTEQAWREIAGIRPVNDFKPTKSLNLLGDVLYKQLGPTGQLVDASLGDQYFANQANPYGRIITIPWTHLVNDDLGMLGQVPMKIGQGAGLALNDYFWALWASLASGSVVGVIPSGTNLNGDDGVAFWRITSVTTASAKKLGTAYLPNKDTGAALSASTLKTGKALFDNQIDPNGNPLGFDGSMPILLFGPSNWQNAMTLMQSPVLVAAGLASTSAYSSAGSSNVWQGSMRPVMSRYIENASYGNSATAFWILFNPAALAVIEACFLNGVDTPAVLQAGPDYQFDKLGISIRGTMPFGVSQQNFRGGIFNPGA